MNAIHSDALVFFGATGDLAYKKIFPVAAGDGEARASQRAGDRRGQGRLEPRSAAARAQDSSKNTAGSIPPRSTKLMRLLRYVDGDYNDPATFDALRKELGSRSGRRTISPFRRCCSGRWSNSSQESGCAKGARVVDREAIRPDLASAASSTGSCSARFDEIDLSASTITWEEAGPQHAVLPLRQRVHRTVLEPHYVESVQITMAEDFGVQGRGAFYDQTGTIRDVVQNHLFQVLSNLAMEPPVRTDSESIRDEKVKVLKAIPPLKRKTSFAASSADIARERRGADSQVETFAALGLQIDSWRWQGVPFYIRAGKCLPVTAPRLSSVSESRRLSFRKRS